MSSLMNKGHVLISTSQVLWAWWKQIFVIWLSIPFLGVYCPRNSRRTQQYDWTAFPSALWRYRGDISHIKWSIGSLAAELNAGESKPGRSTIHAFEYWTHPNRLDILSSEIFSCFQLQGEVWEMNPMHHQGITCYAPMRLVGAANYSMLQRNFSISFATCNRIWTLFHKTEFEGTNIWSSTEATTLERIDV